MLFDNPVFGNWYTDTVDIWRMVPVRDGNLDGMERKKINQNPVPCRVYETKKEGPAIGENAAGRGPWKSWPVIWLRISGPGMSCM